MNYQVDSSGICKLVACASDELKIVAERLSLPLSVAKAFRTVWRRKLEGKCMVCGVRVRGNTCARHKSANGKLLDDRRPRTLLKKVPPDTILLKRTCACGRDITIRAKDLLWQFKRFGTIMVHHSKCRQCVAKLRSKNVSRPITPVQPIKVRPVVPEELKYADLPNTRLTYNPFAALKHGIG